MGQRKEVADGATGVHHRHRGGVPARRSRLQGAGVAPPGFIEDCRADLQEQVSPEYKKCQVEIGTRVCPSIGAARDDLRRLRSTISRHAGRHGLTPIAASCHPFSDWKHQHHTDKERYHGLERDLAGVARRLLICGCHVHVGIEDNALRADLLRQMPYFLPHLLALSTSSPFWQGEDTGLASYRISVFDNLPRTGLPPDYQSWAELQRSVDVLVDLGIIEDSSKIWWDIRPSHRYPTLETRIMDVSPRAEDASARWPPSPSACCGCSGGCARATSAGASTTGS